MLCPHCHLPHKQDPYERALLDEDEAVLDELRLLPYPVSSEKRGTIAVNVNKFILVRESVTC